jgi:hypothetical protein
VERKSMQRVERSARAVLHGAEILQFVRTPKVRAKLIAVAETGAPPVTAISLDLINLVGAADAKLAPIKQFTGRCVRAVLEEEGFAVAEAGVRLSKDALFRTASVYKRASTPAKTGATALLVRFIETLTDAEAQQALQLLKKRR